MQLGKIRQQIAELEEIREARELSLDEQEQYNHLQKQIEE